MHHCLIPNTKVMNKQQKLMQKQEDKQYEKKTASSVSKISRSKQQHHTSTTCLKTRDAEHTSENHWKKLEKMYSLLHQAQDFL